MASPWRGKMYGVSLLSQIILIGGLLIAATAYLLILIWCRRQTHGWVDPTDETQSGFPVIVNGLDQSEYRTDNHADGTIVIESPEADPWLTHYILRK